MRIAVLGAGNGGTAIAADLKRKGHRVTLLKTSDKLNNDNFDAIVAAGGEIIMRDLTDCYHVTIDKATANFGEALTDDIELIIIYIQTNYHEQLIKKMIPFLHDGQIILLEPGYLSTVYFKKYCGALDLTIVEAESSPLDCRITAPGEVSVLFRNVRNPVAVSPTGKEERTLGKLEALHFNFTSLQSPLEAALNNPNLIVHTIGAIMSIPRIEYSKGQYWMYKEVFTQSIWNLVLALDEEKMSILEKLDLPRVPYVDACKFRNSEDLTLDSKEVFDDYAQNNSVKGPFVSNSRYITEDVPEGLVLMESLGQYLDIATPVCTSLIEIASACLQTDYRGEGRTLSKFGFENFKACLNNTRQSMSL